ncbi:MAG: 3-deoxy-D-manno-octulosonic acid transferase, partial [Halothiobacillaceae bacterium]
ALGDALLVVAPRHPERRREILRLLADFRVAVRSQGDPVDADTEVYLVDTLGELPAFMAGARLVFMGGSLVPRGGHNLLEPAALGAPVIVGPHVDNFSEEFELLQAAAAVRQVPDEQALGEAIRVLWPDEATRRQMANAGQAVMARQAGVLESYVARLSEADTWRIPDKG